MGIRITKQTRKQSETERKKFLGQRSKYQPHQGQRSLGEG